jgi:hypothetical protein
MKHKRTPSDAPLPDFLTPPSTASDRPSNEYRLVEVHQGSLAGPIIRWELQRKGSLFDDTRDGWSTIATHRTVEP